MATGTLIKPSNSWGEANTVDWEVSSLTLVIKKPGDASALTCPHCKTSPKKNHQKDK
jgi:hypothetical protein